MKKTITFLFTLYFSTFLLQAQLFRLTGTVKYVSEEHLGNIREVVSSKDRIGGLTFDETNPNVVYLSTDVGQIDNKRGEIIKGEVIRDSSSKIIGFKNWVHYKNAPNIVGSFAFLDNGDILYRGFASSGYNTPKSESFYQIAANEDRIVKETKYSAKDIGRYASGIVKNPSWHPQPNDFTAFSYYSGVNIPLYNLKTNKSNNYTINLKIIGFDNLNSHLDTNGFKAIAYVPGHIIPELKHDPERKERDVAFFLRSTGGNYYNSITYCYINPDGTVDANKGRQLKSLLDKEKEKYNNYYGDILNNIPGYYNNLAYDPISKHLLSIGIWFDSQTRKNVFGYEYINIGIVIN